MTSEIICTLIAATSAVLSALIAWFVSRSTASKEMEKLMLTWSREDIVSSDTEFSALASAVAEYAHTPIPGLQRSALSAVAALRAKESGKIGVLLDQLYASVEKGLSTQADQLLTQVIEQKREAESHGNAHS